MSSQHGWTMDDATAEGLWEDANPYCIECDERGCLADRCPSSFCDLPHLVIHMGEPVHETCVAAFDRHVENKCGAECVCAVPELVDDTETAPLEYEPMRVTVFGRFALVAGLLLALALGSQGCAAHAQPVEVESVCQLAAGPSVYSAPVAHDAPPELGTIVDTGSDDVSAEVSTTTRTADAGEPDAAPEVTAKGGGLLVGGVR